MIYIITDYAGDSERHIVMVGDGLPGMDVKGMSKEFYANYYKEHKYADPVVVARAFADYMTNAHGRSFKHVNFEEICL